MVTLRRASDQVGRINRGIAGATRVAGYLNVLGVIDDAGDIYLGFKRFFENNAAGGDKVYRLDFFKNEKTLLTGVAEFNARWDILLVNSVTRVGQQVGRVNSTIRRVERV